MAIYAEITCDKCGAGIRWEHVAKQYIIIWARQRGWSVGKNTLCPLCRTKRKSGGIV